MDYSVDRAHADFMMLIDKVQVTLDNFNKNLDNLNKVKVNEQERKRLD